MHEILDDQRESLHIRLNTSTIFDIWHALKNQYTNTNQYNYPIFPLIMRALSIQKRSVNEKKKTMMRVMQ
jgi:hypothetical protein